MEYEVDLVSRTIKLDQAIYQPIIEVLADGPQTLRSLMKQPDLTQRDFATILQALKILMATYHVTPALSPITERDRRAPVAELNQTILKRARFGADTQILASPVTASGIDVSRPEQLFLLAHRRQADPVKFVWSILQVQGEKLLKEGEVLKSPEANLTELQTQAKEFAEQRLPLFQRLGLV
jgi:hypothetical protein